MLPSFRLIFIIRSSVVIDRLSRLRVCRCVEWLLLRQRCRSIRRDGLQVPAKLRATFGVRYWTVVQHQRDARAANARSNIFVADHDAHMKKRQRPPEGAGPLKSGVEILGTRRVLPAQRS